MSDGTDALGASGGAAGAGPAGTGGTELGGSGGASGNGGSSASAGGRGGSIFGGGSGGSPDNGGTGGGGTGGSASADAGATLNLLDNPGFEGGHLGWIAFGNSAILDVDAEGRGGSRCISSVNRTATFEGPAHSIENLVEGGGTYSVEAWVRVNASNQPLSLSLKTVCDGTSDSYAPIVSVFAGAGAWTHLAGQFTAPTCALAELSFYIEGPASGISFYVDDVSLYHTP